MSHIATLDALLIEAMASLVRKLTIPEAAVALIGFWKYLGKAEQID
jgi:hypothetical protein